MDTNSVLEVLGALDDASVTVWLDGGWGVDALLGEQTREHGDLDVVLAAQDAPRLGDALHAIGFETRPGGTGANFVLVDERGREVDVHAIGFDRRGCGIFELPDGRRWPFPPTAFAGRGRVGGRPVHCLSAEAQVQCHGQGYEPTENDLRDMERLQERFGVVLPLGLCRQPMATMSKRPAPGRSEDPMHVDLAEASASQAPVLANLLSLYMHDFSEVFGGAPGAEGRFEYERLPLYFEEPGRTPLLIRADGMLAGFALVSRGSQISAAADVWDLSEFFVVRGLRRRGVGLIAASAVFGSFPGDWEVRALEKNPGAAEFWARAIAAHTGDAFEVEPWVSESDSAWKVFRFSQAEA